MIIRKAKLNDAKNILRLYNQSKNLYGEDSVGYDMEDIKDYIKKDSVFLALLENKAVGAMFLEFYTNYIYLNTIIVDEKYRKKGIGKALVDFLEDLAKKKKVELIEMFVEENNSIMKGFLSKRNYNSGKKFIYYLKEIE